MPRPCRITPGSIPRVAHAGHLAARRLLGARPAAPPVSAAVAFVRLGPGAASGLTLAAAASEAMGRLPRRALGEGSSGDFGRLGLLWGIER